MCHCLKRQLSGANMEAAVAAEFDDSRDGSADEGELLALVVHH